MVLLLSILVGELCLLVSWCVGDRWNMAGSNEDLGRSSRSGAKDRGWSSTGRVLDDRMIGRSGDAVCGLHRAQRNKEHMFFGLASKPRSTVSQFGPQNRQLRFVIWASKSLQRFLGLGLKITATVSSICRLRHKTDGRRSA
jgi:hypothetical protein